MLWKTKFFYKKLEYQFLVEAIAIESTIFPYKIALSEANVETNWMGSTKYTHHKQRSFATSHFIFLTNWFEYKNLL